ncbi:MAG: hypothetical protein KVP17_001376 [Porospora cf. gigantea B]|uniref:uncharacterized protein n=1 Tax=Porospora cf. gigantea B TaxID=2853592 RepID=UPI003571D6EA|nr:MAG: hypothetical protein KVP17_001376 [Porospora cf. gigantea B]
MVGVDFACDPTTPLACRVPGRQRVRLPEPRVVDRVTMIRLVKVVVSSVPNLHLMESVNNVEVQGRWNRWNLREHVTISSPSRPAEFAPCDSMAEAPAVVQLSSALLHPEGSALAVARRRGYPVFDFEPRVVNPLEAPPLGIRKELSTLLNNPKGFSLVSAEAVTLAQQALKDLLPDVGSETDFEVEEVVETELPRLRELFGRLTPDTYRITMDDLHLAKLFLRSPVLHLAPEQQRQVADIGASGCLVPRGSSIDLLFDFTDATAATLEIEALLERTVYPLPFGLHNSKPQTSTVYQWGTPAVVLNHKSKVLSLEMPAHISPSIISKQLFVAYNLYLTFHVVEADNEKKPARLVPIPPPLEVVQGLAPAERGWSLSLAERKTLPIRWRLPVVIFPQSGDLQQDSLYSDTNMWIFNKRVDNCS